MSTLVALMIDMLLMVRCAAAFYTFVLAAGVMRLAIAMLPTDHPGRTYTHGRWQEGTERMRQALSERAANRYIAARRHSR